MSGLPSKTLSQACHQGRPIACQWLRGIGAMGTLVHVDALIGKSFRLPGHAPVHDGHSLAAFASFETVRTPNVSSRNGCICLAVVFLANTRNLWAHYLERGMSSC